MDKSAWLLSKQPTSIIILVHSWLIIALSLHCAAAIAFWLHYGQLSRLKAAHFSQSALLDAPLDQFWPIRSKTVGCWLAGIRAASRSQQVPDICAQEGTREVGKGLL